MELICTILTIIFTLYGICYMISLALEGLITISEKISAKIEKRKKIEAEREWNEYVEQCKAERLQRIYKRMAKQMAKCSTPVTVINR